MSETKNLDDILGVTQPSEATKSAETKATKDKDKNAEAKGSSSTKSSTKVSKEEKEKDTKNDKNIQAEEVKSTDKAIKPSEDVDTITHIEGNENEGKSNDEKSKGAGISQKLKADECAAQAADETQQTSKQAAEGNQSTTKNSEPAEADSESVEEVPRRIKLVRPITTYRGPAESLASKPFGGTVEITGPTRADGFTPVTYFRSGQGVVRGYIRLPKEAMK